MKSLLIFLLGFVLFTLALLILSPVSVIPNIPVITMSGEHGVIIVRIIGWVCGITGSILMMSQV